jgi:hypothetical protein
MDKKRGLQFYNTDIFLIEIYRKKEEKGPVAEEYVCILDIHFFQEEFLVSYVSSVQRGQSKDFRIIIR